MDDASENSRAAHATFAQSVRSATSGSTRLARRAGDQAAAAATRPASPRRTGDVEQQAGEGLREQQRREQPDREAVGAADDHPHDVARLGPHRQAQADLAGPLGGGHAMTP